MLGSFAYLSLGFAVYSVNARDDMSGLEPCSNLQRHGFVAELQRWVASSWAGLCLRLNPVTPASPFRRCRIRLSRLGTRLGDGGF